MPTFPSSALRTSSLSICSAAVLFSHSGPAPRALMRRPSALLVLRPGESCFRLASRPRALPPPGLEVDARQERAGGAAAPPAPLPALAGGAGILLDPSPRGSRERGLDHRFGHCTAVLTAD